MSTFDPTRYTVQKVREMILEVPILDENGQETGEFDRFTLKVKPIPWARKNQIKSLALHFDSSDTMKWDGDYWFRECLKEMIVEASWGKTDDKFLLSIQDGPLGEALESLVPVAFAPRRGKVLDPNLIKKEPSDI